MATSPLSPPSRSSRRSSIDITSVKRPETGIGMANLTLGVFAPVLPITHASMRRVPDLVARYPMLQARDLVHVATCIHEGITEIVSADTGFDVVHELRRFDPETFAASLVGARGLATYHRGIRPPPPRSRACLCDEPFSPSRRVALLTLSCAAVAAAAHMARRRRRGGDRDADAHRWRGAEDRDARRIDRSSSPARRAAPPTDGGSGSSGAKQVPDDACSVITDTDIKELFGGDVEPVENDDDEDNSCSFSVTKANGLVQDWAADIPQIVGVTFDEGYISYDEEHAAMGDAVDKVEGLGSEAWIGLGAIHVDLGDENELVVTTVFGEIYDPTVITGERYALAKMVLARL